MSRTRDELVEHLTPPPGITMPPYPAQRDRFYRYSLLGITLSITWEGLSTLTHEPALIFWAQGAVSLTILSASATFLVWLKSWRNLVRALAIAGFLLWPFVPLAGWAASLASAAIMAAKETHCFRFPAGRVIPWYSLLFGVAMIAHVPHVALGIGWLGLAGLWSWLTRGRFRLPLFEV
ncbi:MAG: hypothetical protein OWU33_02160 [Firmicutes bacterium]|nr:hypothetical protein [Bacillota bacterium]